MKLKIAICIILIMVILTGCWGKSELRDVGIVSGIGIDKGKDNSYELTTQTIKPGTPIGGSPTSVFVQSSSGKTVFEAIRNFIITAKKKQIFQHIHAVIIGKDIALNGVNPVLDFFIRDHEPRFSMDLFIAEDKAKEILEVQNKKFPIPSLTMKESVKVQGALSKAPQVTLHNFYQRLVEPYEDPYLPIIHKTQDDDFEVYGTAIFKGDKLVGELTPFETRGMLRVLGEVKGGIQIIEMPSLDGESVRISIEIKKSKTSISAFIKNNQPYIQIEIKETGFIGDVSKRMLLKEEEIQKITLLYEDSIKQEMQQAVSKIQKEFKSNVFDFHGTIERKDKHYWKQHKNEWENIYPTVQVDVKVVANIPANGLIDSERSN
jgi:spore germination protein KC